MKAAQKLIQIFRKRSIIFSAALMLFLVVANAAFLIYNNGVLERTNAIQAETQEIKTLVNLMWDDVVRNLDIGIRGYALTQDEGLLNPYENGINIYNTYQQQVQDKLLAQGYPNLQSFQQVKNGYNEYIKFSQEMVEVIKNDNIELYKSELKKDRGLALWKVYEKFSIEVKTYEDALYAEATARYQAANTQMTYIQILLGIIGAPTLLFMIIRVIKDERSRKKLFQELEHNNREYLFNPGTEREENDEQELINNSILNFKKAASFISQISAGNLHVDWEDLSEQNKELNKHNLAGELVQMREKMKQLKAEDAKRRWATEGQAQFSEIIRKYQHDLQLLCDQSVGYIVKYLSAQQGSLFLLKEEGDEPYLEMVGCYAFNRKKFVEKRIGIGQGLVGQVYLEKEPVIISKVPQAYTSITSGLGEATPSCLLVVPLIYNEKVEAVIEIASFIVYEKHQLDWLSKVGEIMASTLISISTTLKTQDLLAQFKDQAEQLQAQEEELRQNMEEMEATQEEMRRKEQELERRHYEMQELLNEKNS